MTHATPATDDPGQKTSAASGAGDDADASLLFAHPTGKTPNTVHVVCTGFSKERYYAALSEYEPKIPRGDEVWTLNKTTRHQRADLIFMLDDLVGEFNKAPFYTREIIEASVHTPVITTTLDAPGYALLREHGGPAFDVGAMINWYEYPMHTIRDWLGASFGALFQHRTGREHGFTTTECRQMGNDLLYFRNSVPMILAYALAIEVKTLYLWGADYDHPISGNRLEDDKPNCEYWVGFCRGRGMNVIIPKGSTLLKKHLPDWLYGYGARQPDLRVNA